MRKNVGYACVLLLMISMEDKKKRTAPGFEVEILELQQHIVRTSSLIYRLF